jgi:hypothetical protein
MSPLDIFDPNDNSKAEVEAHEWGQSPFKRQEVRSRRKEEGQGPTPPGACEGAYKGLGRMVLLTGFLVFARRRAKSKSGESRRELEHYLNEFGG